ncbi:hypothetical protein BDN70DRAFT_875356 [Pholiota conissans]|uniref:N-acetyltransferase domain-containing protein n=1 Tax=Pholiota conissans TaxID=109636 RepID=A0A9P6D393_9AGAR|nr:hypothetical protein BDN70DRAFT_875356 [Pholiota conissans]
MPTPSESLSHQSTTIVDSVQNTPRIQIATVTNADAFGSSLLTGGSMFDLQDMPRVTPTARTMIVATPQNDVEGRASPGASQAEWLGTLSILSPAGLSQRPRDKPFPPRILDIIERGEEEIWVIIGVWVNPEYRRRGIGRLLLQHALNIIRTQPDEQESCDGVSELLNADETAPKARRVKNKKLVMLYVRENNDIAREMYEKAGFVAEKDAVLNEVDDVEISGWMSMYINN